MSQRATDVTDLQSTRTRLAIAETFDTAFIHYLQQATDDAVAKCVISKLT